MSDRSRKFPHIYLPNNGKSESYTGRGGGKSPPPPERNRIEHAQFLEQTIGLAIQDARQQLLPSRSKSIEKDIITKKGRKK